MAELTREQKKALALAKARQRAAEAQSGAQDSGQGGEAPSSFLGVLKEMPVAKTVLGGAQAVKESPGMARQVAEGMTLGYGDEGSAAIEAALGDPKSGKFFDYSRPFGERYQSGVEQEQAAREQFAAENPMPSMVAELLGAGATGAGLARGGATLMGRGATTGQNVGLAAVEGGLYGGVYGSGKAKPGERATSAAIGAGAGAATGGALSYGGRKVVDALARSASAKDAPSLEMLKRGADAAYDAARAKNPKFTGVDEFATQARQTLTDQGFHPRLHPKLRVVLREIEELGPDADFKTLEKVRRMVKGASGNFNNPDEQRLGRMLVEGLDNFVQTKAPTPEVQIGRELYGRFKRGSMIDDALEQAVRRASSTGSGGNVENAMRQNIRRILDSSKKRAGFSRSEIEAMEEFVRGGQVQNFMRLVGKLSPSGNGLMAMLSGVGGGVGMGATGNPLFLGPMIAGMGAKGLADAGARRQAAVISSLARQGGKAPQVPAYLRRGQVPVVRALSGYGGGLTSAAQP